jgi:hypothetical protein
MQNFRSGLDAPSIRLEGSTRRQSDLHGMCKSRRGEWKVQVTLTSTHPDSLMPIAWELDKPYKSVYKQAPTCHIKIHVASLGKSAKVQPSGSDIGFNLRDRSELTHNRTIAPIFEIKVPALMTSRPM